MQWLCTRLGERDHAATALPLALDFAARQRSRQRQPLPDGTVLAIALPTGTTLRHGDVLAVDDHPGFVVLAAPQPLLRARTTQPLLLSRAAYHLGNRHCSIQIQPDAVLLERDPVLRDMLQRLGLMVEDVEQPFEPETGAYGGGHKHGHDHTFASDHALAKAVFQLHDGKHPHAVLQPHAHHD